MKTRIWIIPVLLLAALGCTKENAKNVGEKAQNAAQRVAKKVDDAIDVAVPLGQREDPKERERERLDESWRKVGIFQKFKPGPQGPPAPKQVPVTFVANGKESFKNLDGNAINAAPVVIPIKGDMEGPSTLKTQVYLDRLHFSVGPLDGQWGRNSAITLWWFQRSHGLEATGAVDEPTFRALAAMNSGVPALVQHTLTDDDVKGPFVSIPDDVYEKEKLDCLCYESKKEKLAELFHTTADFLDKMNPNVDFANAAAGQTIWVPNVRAAMTSDQPDIAKVVVSIRGNTFNAFDAADNLIFHAPTTLGSKYDPSPDETTKVIKITRDPHFHYQPTLFHEVPDSDPEAMLNPGPNSPVGVVWIALSKPHFGIHGTSDPDSIGYASSHGCVRLTNWDASEVSHRIRPDVPVMFVDTRQESSD